MKFRLTEEGYMCTVSREENVELKEDCLLITGSKFTLLGKEVVAKLLQCSVEEVTALFSSADTLEVSDLSMTTCVPCRMYSVYLGDLFLREFYFCCPVEDDVDTRVSLIGRDLFSACAFNGAFNSDIQVNVFDHTVYKRNFMDACNGTAIFDVNLSPFDGVVVLRQVQPVFEKGSTKNSAEYTVCIQ